MSWDVSMVIDTGGEYPSEVCEVGNMTYNVAPMYFQAFGTEAGLRGLDGMLGCDALPVINTAMVYMREHAAEMRALNPKNGWGNSERAYEFLVRIHEACAKHPKASVRIS